MSTTKDLGLTGNTCAKSSTNTKSGEESKKLYVTVSLASKKRQKLLQFSKLVAKAVEAAMKMAQERVKIKKPEPKSSEVQKPAQQSSKARRYVAGDEYDAAYESSEDYEKDRRKLEEERLELEIARLERLVGTDRARIRRKRFRRHMYRIAI